MDRELIGQAALQYHRAGWAPVLLREGTKRAAFRAWNERAPLTRAEIQQHFRRRGFNVGLWMRDGTVVVDQDGPEADDLLRRHGISSPFVVVTPKGRHVYMRLTREIGNTRSRIRFLGLPLDVKLTGYTVAPPSWFAETEWRYQLAPGTRLVAPADLPPVPESFLELLEERQEETRGAAAGALARPDDVAARYVDKIPPSVQGEGGSRAYIVACLKILSLTRGDTERAWPLLVYWNARCAPPWDTEATAGPDSLRRKLTEARKFWKE